MNKESKTYDALVRMPKTMGLLFMAALLMASVMASVLTSLHRLYVYYQPASNWFEVENIWIPNIDLTNPKEELVASFRRKVHGDPVTAQWYSEVILYDNAGIEYCRNRGINVYTDKANSSTIMVPLKEWLGPGCEPPPGCYYQEATWEFEIDDVKKSVNAVSNRFSITGQERQDYCRTLQLPPPLPPDLLNPGAQEG